MDRKAVFHPPIYLSEQGMEAIQQDMITMSQLNIAKSLGVTRATLINWVRGQRINRRGRIALLTRYGESALVIRQPEESDNE